VNPPETPDAADDLIPGAARPFWEASRERRLVLPRCRPCEAAFWFPRAICPVCGSDRIEWFESAGRGVVHASSVHHRPPSRDFDLESPYVVALVELAEGIRMMTNIVECPPQDVAAGMEVQPCWHPLPDGRHLLRFRPADGTDT